MSSHREQLRIMDLEMSFRDVFTVLAEGNPGALNVMVEMYKGEYQLQIISLDALHLYGHHIAVVYKNVCGQDLDRFLYHLAMELPCQICGTLSITGPHSADLSDEASRQWFAARTHGGRGKYWALENPPESPEYRYPLTPTGEEPSVSVAIEDIAASD